MVLGKIFSSFQGKKDASLTVHAETSSHSGDAFNSKGVKYYLQATQQTFSLQTLAFKPTNSSNIMQIFKIRQWIGPAVFGSLLTIAELLFFELLLWVLISLHSTICFFCLFVF